MSDTTPAVGDDVLAVDPDTHLCYTLRAEVVREVPDGAVVTGAVRHPRRYRGKVLTAHIPAQREKG